MQISVHSVIAIVLVAVLSAWSDQTTAEGSVPAPNANAAATQESESTSQKLARVVLGIVSYTEWKGVSKPRLCVLQKPSLMTALVEANDDGRYELQETRALELQQLDGCQAVYFGAVAPESKEPLIRGISRKPVLMLDENSQYCDEGAHFCLDVQVGGHIGFQLNLDALTMSGLRVSPQVLRLGQPQREKP